MDAADLSRVIHSLLESTPSRTRWGLAVAGIVSLALHAVVIAGAVAATRNAGHGDTGEQGHAVFEVVVDASGRAFPLSFRVTRTPPPRWGETAEQALQAVLVRPGRVGGSVLFGIPVVLTLQWP